MRVGVVGVARKGYGSLRLIISSMFPKTYKKLKKNTKRAISKETAEAVIKRDGCCIICNNSKISQVHHCFF